MTESTLLDAIALEITERVCESHADLAHSVQAHARSVLTKWFLRETQHTYPDRHMPGATEWTTKAWALLDQVPPGVIPRNFRYMLGGMIAGALHKQDQEEKALTVLTPMNSYPINAMWVVLSVDDNGEGICAVPMEGTTHLTMPLVTGSERNLAYLLAKAIEVAEASRRTVRVVKFTQRETVREIVEGR